MTPQLLSNLTRVRPSTVVLTLAFVGLFALWVLVRTPSDGPDDGFTPLGAAASAAHLHLDPTPTPTAEPTPSPTPAPASRHKPAHAKVSGGAATASNGHAPSGGS